MFENDFGEYGENLRTFYLKNYFEENFPEL